jgi:protein ImuA
MSAVELSTAEPSTVALSAGESPTVAPSAGEPRETLNALRRVMAAVTTSRPGEEARLGLGVASLDQALGGGLAGGALHEIGPAAPRDGGAATGFAVALAVLALREGRQAIWIRSDFAAAEAGELYGPGLALMGLALQRLIILRVPRPRDGLWAMEEALQCRAVGAVVTELMGTELMGTKLMGTELMGTKLMGDDGDLTATRRLALAAGAGGGLGLILRHQPCRTPNAAMTRWEVASAGGERDGFGGLALPTFAVSLTKNRHGPTGQWRLSWDHHERAFVTPAVPAALSLPVAAAPRDRSSRPQPFARAG